MTARIADIIENIEAELRDNKAAVEQNEARIASIDDDCADDIKAREKADQKELEKLRARQEKDLEAYKKQKQERAAKRKAETAGEAQEARSKVEVLGKTLTDLKAAYGLRDNPHAETEPTGAGSFKSTNISIQVSAGHYALWGR